MRPCLPLIALLALAACERADTPPGPVAAVEAPTQAAAPPTTPPAAPEPAQTPGGSLPPADAEFRYVGGWAADAGACAAPPWRFEPRRLSTAGEVGCEFAQVTPRAGGYDIDAVCTAQAPPERHRIRLTFAESAKAMLVEGGPFGAQIGLVWCGPLQRR